MINEIEVEIKVIKRSFRWHNIADFTTLQICKRKIENICIINIRIIELDCRILNSKFNGRGNYQRKRLNICVLFGIDKMNSQLQLICTILNIISKTNATIKHKEILRTSSQLNYAQLSLDFIHHQHSSKY